MITFKELKRNLKKDISNLRNVRVAVLGDSATQLLATAIKGMGVERGYNIDLFEAEYNQIERQILDPSSELYHHNSQYVVIYHSTHKLMEKYAMMKSDEKINLAKERLDLIRTICQQIDGSVIYYNYPEIDDTVEVEIREEDIKMEVYRASGAGGQKVNKTSSAVRLIHEPTGIVVSCQVERSQHQNREVCMKMLKSKLIEIKEREHLDKIEDIKGEQKEIGWGSQIRSYVFMPYTLVKDHRTGFEMGNINAVMDGDIDGFLNAYLKKQSLDALGTE